VAACTYGHTKVLLHICNDLRFDGSIGDQHLIRWCCRGKLIIYSLDSNSI
jgi:hypothetical protein